MSKDVKPLTPTKRTKPYTIKELAALKDAQGPRAESLLDFLGVQATVEALDEARADNAALLERLKKLEAHEGQLDRLRKELDEYKEAIKLERKGHEQRARTLEAEIESRRRWEKECEKAEAEADAYRQRVGIEEAARGESEKLLRIIAAERDAAEARVKELESELKEAHRQRLEACEGESERAVERDEALKELEEVKARADAAEARVKELEEALAVAFNHTIDKGLTFVARRHEDLGERLWDLAKSLARAAPSTHERARSSGSPPPPRQESEAMSKKPVEPQPNIIDGVPFCSDEDCPLYDGKRCEALGARPGNICEPAVDSMAVDLATTIANQQRQRSALATSQAANREALAALEAVSEGRLAKDKCDAAIAKLRAVLKDGGEG